jgi:hypothetical protein
MMIFATLFSDGSFDGRTQRGSIAGGTGADNR